MGSSCCRGQPIPEQGELLRKSTNIRNTNERGDFGYLELDFMDRFPEMRERVEKITKELPRNWIINRDFTTIVKEQGVFLGKKNVRVRSGYGIMLYDLGFYYVGCWQDNTKFGMGIMVDKHGSHYKGEWVYDEANGYGEYYDCKHNWNYKGKWKNGKKDGLGEENYPDGTKFVGTYKDDVKQGPGKFIFNKNCYFLGQLKNDEVCGEGVQRGVDYLYEGPWLSNEMQGAGTVQYFNQKGTKKTDRYVGQFQNSIKHGYGQYRWQNGTTYKGEWINGRIANRGVLLEKG